MTDRARSVCLPRLKRSSGEVWVCTLWRMVSGDDRPISFFVGYRSISATIDNPQDCLQVIFDWMTERRFKNAEFLVICREKQREKFDCIRATPIFFSQNDSPAVSSGHCSRYIAARLRHSYIEVGNIRRQSVHTSLRVEAS